MNCARTRKTHVSDRAKRYRANQAACRPSGARECALCKSSRFLTIDHKDGDESNGAKSNLRWLCKSCNTREGAKMARKGKGRRTAQYNPGAKSLGEYLNAIMQHTRGAHDEGGRILHETSKAKRAEYASEIWARRKSHGNPGQAIGQGAAKLIEVGGGRKKKVWQWQGQAWPKEDFPGFVSLGSIHYGDRKSGKVFVRGNPLKKWTPATLNGARVRIRAVGKGLLVDLGKVLR